MSLVEGAARQRIQRTNIGQPTRTSAIPVRLSAGVATI
jgi:hypothetical protein